MPMGSANPPVLDTGKKKSRELLQRLTLKPLTALFFKGCKVGWRAASKRRPPPVAIAHDHLHPDSSRVIWQ
jgi:hypothetical protein